MSVWFQSFSVNLCHITHRITCALLAPLTFDGCHLWSLLRLNLDPFHDVLDSGIKRQWRVGLVRTSKGHFTSLRSVYWYSIYIEAIFCLPHLYAVLILNELSIFSTGTALLESLTKDKCMLTLWVHSWTCQYRPSRCQILTLCLGLWLSFKSISICKEKKEKGSSNFNLPSPLEKSREHASYGTIHFMMTFL